MPVALEPSVPLASYELSGIGVRSRESTEF